MVYLMFGVLMAQTPDSDGDGIPDAKDRNPFVAEFPHLSWKVTELRLGWEVNVTEVDKMVNISTEERQRLKRTDFRFDAGTSARLGGQGGAVAYIGGPPVPQFQVDAKFQAFGDIIYSRSHQNLARECSEILATLSKVRAFSRPSLESTVTFYNLSTNDFQCVGLQVPIQIGDDVVALAVYRDANGPQPNFILPARRIEGLPVRFRAELDTTHALALVEFMKSNSPTFKLQRSLGKITAEASGKSVDALSTLQEIRATTIVVRIRLGPTVFQWFVAKMNLVENKPVTIRDAMAAINKTQDQPVFQVVGKAGDAICGKTDSRLHSWQWNSAGKNDSLESILLDSPLNSNLEFTYSRSVLTTNSLGMKFVPVPGTDVLFSVWETRKQDFAAFARSEAGSGLSDSWKAAEYHRLTVSSNGSHPAVNVSYNDAHAFCRWLTVKERQEGVIAPDESYRLPSNKEWSAAVGLSPSDVGRRLVRGVYPWGSDFPPQHRVGNYADDSLRRALRLVNGPNLTLPKYNDGFVTTSPVGSFEPNKFGLFDMGGNVREWCDDSGEGRDVRYVMRGGSWIDMGQNNLLSSSRIESESDKRSPFDGFRVVFVSEGSR